MTEAQGGAEHGQLGFREEQLGLEKNETDQKVPREVCLRPTSPCVTPKLPADSG